MDQIHRSTPLIIEEKGVAERIQMRSWSITMMSGHKGLCWAPAFDDKGNAYPCPFIKGKNCAFTYVEEDGKTPKIRPFDMIEYDKQRVLSRQSAVNSAAALGSSMERFKDDAESIFRWTNELE